MGKCKSLERLRNNMPQVLTTNSIITCPHLGVGVSIPTDLPPKWTVHGGAVLLENDGGIFPLPPSVTACKGIPHCVGYKLQSMGLNATRVSGRRVILVTDFNQTFTRVPLKILPSPLDISRPTIDDSTSVFIPNGQPVPPLASDLIDLVAPAVNATPKTLAFTAPNTPATASITFTLTSAHPLKWILTLLNKPLKSHKDLTNGEPPGLTVTPLGGAWNNSPLTVTVTMTAAFMAGLTPGEHLFYMTGVSRRGLSTFDETTLTTS
jgi:hypothetical protein